MPPIFLKVDGVGCACLYGAMASLWSSSHHDLASVSTCSLPFMIAWALTLWSVVN